MITTHQHKNLAWIDLQNPTKEEVLELATKYSLSTSIMSELLAPSFKSKAEVHGGVIYAVLHFPAFRHGHAAANQEVDFVIGKDFLITAHYDAVEPIEAFAKVFEVNSILDKSELDDRGDKLFFLMAQSLYESLTHEIDAIKDSLERIEDRIFAGEQKQMVSQLSGVARTLIDLRQGISLHADALASLEMEGSAIFGKKFSEGAIELRAEYIKIRLALRRNREYLQDLRDSNDSLLTTAQNETTKFIATLALVTSPISLISGIFAMDSRFMPIVGLPNDFWILIGIMLFCVAASWLIFNRKGWL